MIIFMGSGILIGMYIRYFHMFIGEREGGWRIILFISVVLHVFTFIFEYQPLWFSFHVGDRISFFNVDL